MASPTHLLETTRLNSEIGPDCAEDVFRRPLARMDGIKRFSAVLSRIALNQPSKGKQRADPGDQHFIQAAGNASQMTIEIRKGFDGGETRLFTIGRPNTKDSATDVPPKIEVSFGANVATVYEFEVFDANEATDVFYHYYKNNDVPSVYSLRERHFPEYESGNDVADK